ncbi:hypothetical protein TVAG_154470 [Trichomonas vaginalis G3]|uniref:Polymorphic outer membrane protein n=1 Tax=Trichomonas vaginalis (strain ATCC PRA-98 / G3) TaxID=412133 RepID=A2E453_TRIV3|nr:lipid binding [Trichomonas vaginalis G3]EAY12596.1 hypothetical protein TVAG_154470 [Trichomonas vaginalis G3]KAI5509375.1 lipid binding [Trichomonas vaginalis G3]|eukprot:XP_001324819.1 hypothetical protein [Trichomonas vaginalis G3]
MMNFLPILYSLAIADDDPPVDQETIPNAPSFQNLKMPKSNIKEIYDNLYISRELSETDNINSQETKFHFYFSNILINKLTVTNCWALGSVVDPSSGGAIHVFRSSLTTSNEINTFTSNRATTGGAICCLQSQVYLMKSIFNQNIAYKFGGAVCYEGDSLVENSLNVKLVLQECKFTGNMAHSCGGGLSALACREAILDHCEFKQNRAASFGGGMECCLTNRLDIFDKKIINNYITNHFFDDKDVAQDIRKNYQNSIRYGGGALYFGGPPMPKDDQPPTTYASFYTQSCCFFNNFVLDKDTLEVYDFSTEEEDKNEYKGRGHEIFLNSYIGWISMNDDFKEPEYSQSIPNQYIYFVKSNEQNLNWAVMQTNGSMPVCEDSGKAIKRIIADEIKYARISNTLTDDQLTSNVEQPTEYTYVATPVTRLPRQTTQSLVYPTARTLEKDSFPFEFSGYSVIPTNAMTPFSTAQPSPIATPERTPEKSPDPTRVPGSGETITVTLTVSLLKTLIFRVI